MKATENNLLTFLGKPQQFTIPIFQRAYSWRRKECEQLYRDVMRIGSDNDTNGHFLGSVVYLKKDLYQVSEVPRLMVIDGQQRLTTLTLLLAAFTGEVERRGGVEGFNPRKVRNRYLLNPDEEGELFYKLQLTRGDWDMLVRVLKQQALPEDTGSRVAANFRYFADKLKDADLGAVDLGLKKLFIVDVALEQGKDNPQLIFESLNSTGLDLTQADLIRNYVLMSLDAKTQEQLYDDVWFPMEQQFGRDYDAHFDNFVRHYLTVRTGRIPKKQEVYEAFRAYARSKESPDDIGSLLRDVYSCSAYYVNFALHREPDDALRRAFIDLSRLKVDVAYPVLLEAYEDYQNGLLGQEQLLELVRLVESYVFRRAVCGIPTNSLNKTFATLLSEVKDGISQDYLENFKLTLYGMTSYRRFPDDVEFEQELFVKDVYNFRSRNYLLDRLENHGRKERVNIESYTIEHVMPQNPNLSETWRQELGEDWKGVQKNYLHTLGNLTLTGYNPELSDRPFKEKRDRADGGFRDSPLRLNRSLSKVERWNEDAIVERAKTLIKKATQVWPALELSEEARERYGEKETRGRGKVYTLSDYEFLTGDMRELFEQFRRRVLNLDASVAEVFNKHYISYKTTTNFVDIVPQKSRLRLAINLAFDEINDPEGLCQDVTDKGRLGNGDIQVGLEHAEQLATIMFLVEQSFEKHMELVEV